MEQLIITLEGKTNAELLMRLLSKFNFVKSVTREKTFSTTTKGVVNEPAETYNWTNPTGPATDKDFEQLVFEMEQDKGEYSSEEVIHFVNEELEAWRKKKK